MGKLIDIQRHRELFDAEQFNTPITILGTGATGSWVALYLAKLGLTDVTMYDFDIVEGHNIANQAFGRDDIGYNKALIMADHIHRDTAAVFNPKGERYKTQRLKGIVFLMVDSMRERKRIWEESIKLNSNVTLLIEPRMGLSMGRVYSVNPTNTTQIKRYEETYYSDDTSEVSACGTSVSVITSATMIASMCVRQLINHANQLELDNEILVDMQYWNFSNTIWK